VVYDVQSECGVWGRRLVVCNMWCVLKEEQEQKGGGSGSGWSTHLLKISFCERFQKILIHQKTCCIRTIISMVLHICNSNKINTDFN